MHTTASDEIIRENCLDTIDQMWSSTVEVVIVRGNIGIGKTTLLRQFAQRHRGQTIEMFIRPLSRLAYELQSLIARLYEQVVDIVEPRKTANPEDIQTADLRNALRALSTKAHRHRRDYYFIIDGLDDIPSEEALLKQLFFDELPLGMPGFRFLLSGNTLPLPARIPTREFTLVPFTSEETYRYLADLVPRRSNPMRYPKHASAYLGTLQL